MEKGERSKVDRKGFSFEGVLFRFPLGRQIQIKDKENWTGKTSKPGIEELSRLPPRGSGGGKTAESKGGEGRVLPRSTRGLTTDSRQQGYRDRQGGG